MIYIIYPEDNSTSFLTEIFVRLKHVYNDVVDIFLVKPNPGSYEECLHYITSLDDRSVVLFMGHGQNDLLFGAESEEFEKKPLIKRNDFSIFKNKFLFSLSCNSNELLRTSLANSGLINSIGFGILPSEMKEVENNKKLREQGVTIEIIEAFKANLVEIIFSSFSYFIRYGVPFDELSDYLILLINKNISKIILDDKNNAENKILADLLYQMRSEFVYF